MQKSLILALALFLLCPALTVSADSSEIARRDHHRFEAHRADLTRDERREINRTLRALVKSKRWLNEISAAPVSNSPVFLLVHGLGLKEDTPAWEKPIHQLKSEGLQGYFFKWSKWRSLGTSAQRLVEAIGEIKAKHPGRKLVIVAHSAGGVISTMALDRIQTPASKGEIFLYTAASPFFGYQAPRIAHVGSLFVGKATIQLGRGSLGRLKNLKIHGCMNWLNTNCKLDKHACLHNGISPQAGAPDRHFSQLPCGNARIGELTHNEIIQDVMDYALVAHYAF